MNGTIRKATCIWNTKIWRQKYLYYSIKYTLTNEYCLYIYIYIYIYVFIPYIRWNLPMELFYRGKEKIHSEIEIIIYKLKWYSPTSIISLALLILRPKFVLVLTDVHSEVSLCFYFYFSFCFSPCFKRHGVFYTSAIPEVTWNEPLYNRSWHQKRTVYNSNIYKEFNKDRSFLMLEDTANYIYWLLCTHLFSLSASQ